MHTDNYTPSLARNTLFVMLAVAIFVIITILFNLDFLSDVYFSRQLTQTGIIINGLILLMFFLGIGKTIDNLLFFRKQEVAISEFLENDLINPDMAMVNIDEYSLIAQRYKTMQNMRRGNSPIDQAALAAILVADESARSSLPKFVNNVLILTGVFGTIVSLSIALLGASDLMQSAGSVGGMNLVVHGMSTALSTTITAIVCFMVFGYFHVRTNDIQTHVVSLLERVSLERLMPRFSLSEDNIIGEVADLVMALRDVSESMRDTQAKVSGTFDEQIASSVAQHEKQLQLMNHQMQEMLATLRAGFRLDHL
jgi:hypothetical protein